MAETWVEVEKIQEHIGLLKKTMGYFHIECLSFAMFDLVAYSRRRTFGIFKRKQLTFWEANEIVSALHCQGAPRPKWCTGPWPNDLDPHNFGICSEWEVEALRRLCEASSTGRIKMEEDQMMRLTAYRDISVRVPEKLKEYMTTDPDELRQRANAEYQKIMERDQMNAGEHQGAEDAFSRFKAVVDTGMTVIIALLMAVFAVVFVMRSEIAAAVPAAVLAIVASARVVFRVRHICRLGVSEEE